MKIESTAFTEEDLKAFFQESVVFERTRARDDLALADRLEAASARLTELVGEMPPGKPGDAASGDEWTSKDVLIHIGLISALYAWITEAIPDSLYLDDVHGTPAYKKHMTYLLAEEIRRELATGAAR